MYVRGGSVAGPEGEEWMMNVDLISLGALFFGIWALGFGVGVVFTCWVDTRP